MQSKAIDYLNLGELAGNKIKWTTKTTYTHN
jgi:hypothetical protein